MKTTKLMIVATLFVAPFAIYSHADAQTGDDLISAVMYQDLDKVKSLAEAGVDLNDQEKSYGSTALILACQYNMVEIGKYLI